MSDDSSKSRLPPPAFPPGSRKHLSNNNSVPVESAGLGDAFISRDEPMPERDRSVEDAIISPDDPMTERKEIIELKVSSDDVGGAFISPDDPMPPRDTIIARTGELPQFGTEGVVVTGMGMDDDMEAEELASAGDPYVVDMVQKVGKLAEAIRAKGEAGLRSTPEMDRFEATLRGYCVGYLAGRRAEDDPGTEY